jgi:hypothetical protein
MTNISKQLAKVVSNELSKNIIPVKTKEGILVGSVLIVADGSIKHIVKDNRTLYANVHLNAIAIKLANLLAKRSNLILCDKLYRADQEYGKWFTDSQLLRSRYQRAIQQQEFDRADVFWARYCESRDKSAAAKNYAESLITI